MSTESLPLPEDRGTLRVSQTVVRKVAQRTADLVPGTAGTAPRQAGERQRPSGTQGPSGKRGNRQRARNRTGHADPRVRAVTKGDTVELAINLAMPYPAPIRPVVDEVRAKVTDEVQRLTPYRVSGVRVTVSDLVPESSARVE